MSIEDAYRFISKMKTDTEFRTKIETASNDQRIEFAQAAGFIFTKAELMQVMEDELNDDALDQVAGGNNCGNDCNGLECSSAQNCNSECNSHCPAYFAPIY